MAPTLGSRLQNCCNKIQQSILYSYQALRLMLSKVMMGKQNATYVRNWYTKGPRLVEMKSVNKKKIIKIEMLAMKWHENFIDFSYMFG